MNNHVVVVLAAVVVIVDGFVDTVGNVLSFAAVVTATCTGAARYTAILLGRPQAQVERATARGFFAGLIGSALLLAIDHL